MLWLVMKKVFLKWKKIKIKNYLTSWRVFRGMNIFIKTAALSESSSHDEGASMTGRSDLQGINNDWEA